MKYIIALSIVFIPSERMLVLLNDEHHSTLLSNQASRLLLEMVTNSQETLSRDDLIQRVWEDYGFKRSNNSLNVAISEIRKSFETLGRDPQMITTIPKVGFKFNASVDPLFDEEGKNEHDTEELIPLSANTAKKGSIGLQFSKINLIKIVSSVSLIAISFIYWKNPTYIVVKKQPITLLYEYKKCKVYAFGTFTEKNELSKQAKEDIFLAKSALHHESINCTRTNFDLYYNKTRPNNQLSNITLIGACERNSNGNHGQCVSIISHYGTTK